jgi:hypothetical protein
MQSTGKCFDMLTVSVAGTGAGEVGTLNLAGSRRSNQRFIGQGSQNSARSGSAHDRSFQGAPPMPQNTGGSSMAANLSGNPMGSSYMASKEANDLQFLGANPQKSESVTRSYGAGGGLVGHLNQQNLGGLGGGGRPQNASSEVGSLYRGEGLGREEDALS